MGIFAYSGLLYGVELHPSLYSARDRLFKRKSYWRCTSKGMTEIFNVKPYHDYPRSCDWFAGGKALLPTWMKLQNITIVLGSSNITDVYYPCIGRQKLRCRERYALWAVHGIQGNRSIIEGLEEEHYFPLANENSGSGRQEKIAIEEESLVTLEWSSICAQVAQFASTPTGVEDARKGHLIIGKSQKESEELLKQTAAACFLPASLDFSGIVDVQDTLKTALSGTTCTINELCSVRTFLFSAKRLSDQLHDASLHFENVANPVQENESSDALNQTFSPLLSILTGMDFCASLEQDLTYCLNCSSLSVIDRASTTLETCRADRRNNMKLLDSLLYEISRKVVEAGGMDSVLVTNRRARLCVAVRASHKSLITNGVVLDVSNSGATLFMEPGPALELNNKEVQLTSQEKAEEAAILKSLTCRLADTAENISKLLEKITILDLACARAGHAKWLSSVEPVFGIPAESMGGNGQGLVARGDSAAISIEGIVHPLLLGPALLKANNGTNQVHDPTRESKLNIPVPIDIKVKLGVNVVVISGPNTGGKTATMKTLGVAVLMAKAGLYLPARSQPILPWFDKVLVDIGDDQSLEQSLSTFSGHVRRLCQIIETSSKCSLVLLDEIGSGTDPSEGAALATAILGYFADHVQLTLATTHYAELNTLKEKDERFESASLEFDVRNLRPTYQVLWGAIGQSNALDIANSLGFDAKVLARAHYWMTKLNPDSREEQVNDLMAPLLNQRNNLQSQSVIAASVYSEVKKLHDELLVEAEDLENRKAAMRLQQEKDVKREVAAAKSCMDEIVSKFSRSVENLHADGKTFSFHAAQSAIAAIVDEYTGKFGMLPRAQTDTVSVEVPTVGDKVLIQSLGKKAATVVEAPTSVEDSLLVQLGSMKIRVRLSEVVSTIKEETRPVQKISRHDVSTASTEVTFEPAVQTSRNTVDLRGMRVVDALRELDLAVARRGPMSVLFIIHGMGTGALQTAVLHRLKEHARVAKFEQESPLNFGCTVAYIR